MALKRMTDTRPSIQKSVVMSRKAWVLLEACGVSLSGTTSSADLGGSSNSQLETLAAEVEKGSLRTVFDQGLRGPKFLVKPI